MSIFKNLGSKISTASQDVAKKTKDLADIAKLNSQINGEESRIKNLYGEIGKLYCEMYKDAEEQTLSPLCANVSEAIKKISDYRDQIQTIKGIKKCPQCGAEVADAAVFCGACGFNTGDALQEDKAEEQPEIEGKVCPHCSVTLSKEAVFCTGCGTRQ